MDASFTPIKRVSYDVSSTRVGDRTDFNKITLFIETDGSVLPSDVIKIAIQTMIAQFSAILGEDKEAENIDKELSESIADSITQLDLEESILEKIAQAGVLKISELRGKTDEEIMSFDGISDKDLEKIKTVLEA